MTLEEAKKQIVACARQMDAQYKRTVFDEWAIISLADNGELRATLSARARERVRDLTWDKSEDALIGAYRGLVRP